MSESRRFNENLSGSFECTLFEFKSASRVEFILNGFELVQLKFYAASQEIANIIAAVY